MDLWYIFAQGSHLILFFSDKYSNTKLKIFHETGINSYLSGQCYLHMNFRNFSIIFFKVVLIIARDKLII